MFETVFGHDRVKKILQRMIQKEALPHGLCFHGPGGIGKRLLARQVARAVFCEQKSGCGSCNHCHKFDSQNHPDYTEVEPDGNDIKVDQIRRVAENLHFRPFEAPARVIVLDQVERLREESANAFLKSLEEPPEYVYFILVTSDLKALLPTIRSRCQKLAFQSLTQANKVEILTNKFGLEADMAARLAGISFQNLETDPESWNLFLKDVKLMITWLKMVLEAGHGVDVFSDITRDRAGFGRFLDHLNAFLRELTRLSMGLPGEPLFTDFGDQLKQFAAQREPAVWRETWNQVTRLHGQRRRNLNHSLWFNALGVAGLGLQEASESRLRERLGKRPQVSR